MRQLLNVRDIEQLGTILGVWAHPDDETFTSCGIMAAAIANGQKVICITATKGESGVQDESKWPASQLAKIRTIEQQAVLRLTGVNEYHWLDFEDGHCIEHEDKGVKLVSQFIDKYAPDTILTFGGDGFTGHEDHKAVHRWVNKAVKLADHKPNVYNAVCTESQYQDHLCDLDKKLNIFFNLSEPKLVDESVCDINFYLTAELSELKYQAIRAMPSQTQLMTSFFDKNTIIKAYSKETFIKV